MMRIRALCPHLSSTPHGHVLVIYVRALCTGSERRPRCSAWHQNRFCCERCTQTKLQVEARTLLTKHPQQNRERCVSGAKSESFHGDSASRATARQSRTPLPVSRIWTLSTADGPQPGQLVPSLLEVAHTGDERKSSVYKATCILPAPGASSYESADLPQRSGEQEAGGRRCWSRTTSTCQLRVPGLWHGYILLRGPLGG